jgi:hypothetical protein
MIDIKKPYRTRDGNRVRIYATDGARPGPVHGAVCSDGEWHLWEWGLDGSSYDEPSADDLIEISQQMTDWFPPEITPVHVGVYNASRRYREDVCRDWDGKTWSLGWRNVDSPLTIAECKNHRIPDVFPWRGFTEPQE